VARVADAVCRCTTVATTDCRSAAAAAAAAVAYRRRAVAAFTLTPRRRRAATISVKPTALTVVVRLSRFITHSAAARTTLASVTACASAADVQLTVVLDM